MPRDGADGLVLLLGFLLRLSCNAAALLESNRVRQHWLEAERASSSRSTAPAELWHQTWCLQRTQQRTELVIQLGQSLLDFDARSHTPNLTGRLG